MLGRLLASPLYVAVQTLPSALLRSLTTQATDHVAMRRTPCSGGTLGRSVVRRLVGWRPEVLHSAAAHRATRWDAPDCERDDRRYDNPGPTPHPPHLNLHCGHPAATGKQCPIAAIPWSAVSPAPAWHLARPPGLREGFATPPDPAEGRNARCAKLGRYKRRNPDLRFRPGGWRAPLVQL